MNHMLYTSLRRLAQVAWNQPECFLGEHVLGAGVDPDGGIGSGLLRPRT